jgi:transcriptional regulator with XRE-family HTH domain
VISGDLIKQARLRAGLSQVELARRSGKPPSAIGRWERGEVRPPLETVVALVRAAGFDLDVGIVAADEHDRVLIRRCLDRSPADRLAEMVAAATRVAAMTAARG